MNVNKVITVPIGAKKVLPSGVQSILKRELRIQVSLIESQDFEEFEGRAREITLRTASGVEYTYKVDLKLEDVIIFYQQ